MAVNLRTARRRFLRMCVAVPLTAIFKPFHVGIAKVQTLRRQDGKNLVVPFQWVHPDPAKERAKFERLWQEHKRYYAGKRHR